jgi:hypothetical protein
MLQLNTAAPFETLPYISSPPEVIDDKTSNDTNIIKVNGNTSENDDPFQNTPIDENYLDRMNSIVSDCENRGTSTPTETCDISEQCSEIMNEFVCRWCPNKKYASRDGVRKHCRKRHLESLKETERDKSQFFYCIRKKRKV